MSILEGIAIRKQSKGAMVLLPQSPITQACGVANDLRGKPGKRQVTVLSARSWQQACAEINIELPWQVRRANLLVTELEFSAADVGKTLCIGAVRLRITRQTDPCHWMDKAQPGLRQALTPHWRGAFVVR
ncbi:MOSC domain-containing protein [Oceanicoccus sp. KOV_DT_Chl]|uniref:MOSC domain-containing protein n=1 Tax=Oceanicoccus sp. KOV_DT_Chl TaxID=1904639 RepID=UPI00190EF4E2|nr:MOSC domain-containing protein [Oceanicoccus sp. KOV_DT_Chl]